MEEERTKNKRLHWAWLPFLLALLLSFVCVFSATALALLAQPERLDGTTMLPVGTANYGQLDSEKERFSPLDPAIMGDATQDSAGLRLTPGSSGEASGNRKTPVFVAFITATPTDIPIPSPVVATMDAPGTAVPNQPASPTAAPTHRPSRTPLPTATRPILPSPTGMPSITPTAWPTLPATATHTPLPPTVTRTPANPATVTPPAPATATFTPRPSATHTAAPSPTATVTVTAVPPSATHTATAVPPTATHTATATATAVPPTATFTSTPTNTPTATPSIRGLSIALVNADTESVIPGYATMPDGITLDLTSLPTENLNMWVTLDPQYANRVVVSLNGTPHHTEYYYPYTFPGNTYDPGHPNHPYNDFWPYNFSPGSYTLTFQPYADDGTPGGAAGIPFVFNFTVIRSTPPAALLPILNCIYDNGGGWYTAYFGYQNNTGATITIPVGTNNQFIPPPEHRGQPSIFDPGVHNSVVPPTNFEAPNSLSWYLNGNTATASASSPLCP